MPNWCGNQLQVRGPSEVVTQMVAAVAAPDTAFSLEAIAPFPKTDEEIDAIYQTNARTHPALAALFSADKHTWVAQHLWGTKWDTDTVDSPTVFEYAHGLTQVSYRFMTANSPCTAAVCTLSGQYPDLVFLLTYEEPGNGVYGAEVYIAGKEAGALPVAGNVWLATGPEDTLETLIGHAESDLCESHGAPTIVYWERPEPEAIAALETAPGWYAEEVAFGGPQNWWVAQVSTPEWGLDRILHGPEDVRAMFESIGDWWGTPAHDALAVIAERVELSALDEEERANLFSFLLAWATTHPLDEDVAEATAQLRAVAPDDQLFAYLGTIDPSTLEHGLDEFAAAVHAALLPARR